MLLQALLAASLLPATVRAAPAAAAAAAAVRPRHDFPDFQATTRASTAADADAGCAAVHVFISRGSGESYPGWEGSLASSICAGRASCDSENIQYPATRTDYCNSAGAGASGGRAQLVAYGSRCPSARLVLVAWSEGAAVAGDILGGGGGYFPKEKCTQGNTAALSRGNSPGSQVGAVLLFGDVRHTASQSYNTGTAASGNGVWPRTDGELSALNAYAGVLRSYCDTNDPACDNGTDYGVHSSYQRKYSSDAVAFVKSKIP